MVTSIALMSAPGMDLQKELKAVQASIDTTSYHVMDWTEMMRLLQTMQGDQAGNRIMIYILYMVIGFGLFSTVLMMLTERQHEFGIMVSIGTGKKQLSRVWYFWRYYYYRPSVSYSELPPASPSSLPRCIPSG